MTDHQLLELVHKRLAQVVGGISGALARHRLHPKAKKQWADELRRVAALLDGTDTELP